MAFLYKLFFDNEGTPSSNVHTIEPRIIYNSARKKLHKLDFKNVKSSRNQPIRIGHVYMFTLESINLTANVSPR